MKEANTGDPRSTSGETFGSVFERDSTEGEDGDGRGERTGRFERFESLTGGDELACHGFLKNRAEEGDIRLIMSRLLDLSQAVAGDRDHRPGQAGGLVNLTHLRRGKLARS